MLKINLNLNKDQIPTAMRTENAILFKLLTCVCCFAVQAFLSSLPFWALKMLNNQGNGIESWAKCRSENVKA